MTSARTNGITLLMILVLLTSCGSYFDGTVTVYPVGKLETDKQTRTLNRTSYKASFDTQTVVHWWPGLSETPERLVNCTVRDKYNWRCEHPANPSWEIKMVDGRIADRDPDPDTRYVSSFYWHYLNIKSHLLD
jgi:hypothetical protein